MWLILGALRLLTALLLWQPQIWVCSFAVLASAGPPLDPFFIDGVYGIVLLMAIAFSNAELGRDDIECTDALDLEWNGL